MKNIWLIEGILSGFRQFSDKVGSVQVKVTEKTRTGEEYAASYFLNAFGDTLKALGSVPIGSLISISGRVKNSKFEQGGKTIWKQEGIINSFTFEAAEEGVPTRIAKMSPNDPKYRDNSRFDEEMSEIPF